MFLTNYIARIIIDFKMNVIKFKNSLSVLISRNLSLLSKTVNYIAEYMS